MTAGREVAAYVTHRNGAYLIEPTGPAMHTPGPDMTGPDVSSSLSQAKRIAVAMTTHMGYTGAARWAVRAGGMQWLLSRTWDDDYDSGPWVDAHDSEADD